MPEKEMRKMIEEMRKWLDELEIKIDDQGTDVNSNSHAVSELDEIMEDMQAQINGFVSLTKAVAEMQQVIADLHDEPKAILFNNVVRS